MALILVNPQYEGLLNISISDLKEKTEHTIFMRIEDVKQLKGKQLTLKSRAATRRDPDRLEEWVNRSLLKYNQDKCKALSKQGRALPS